MYQLCTAAHYHIGQIQCDDIYRSWQNVVYFIREDVLQFIQKIYNSKEKMVVWIAFKIILVKIRETAVKVIAENEIFCSRTDIFECVYMRKLGKNLCGTLWAK